MTDEPQAAADLAPAGEVGIDARSAEQMKSHTAARRRDLTERRIELETTVAVAREHLERQRAALEAEHRARMAELEATMAPLKAELERLEELSWTVDLYLGRHEDVRLIQDGQPAPADTPITIRQDVVAADEESLILGEEGTFDYNDMSTFVEWLTASPQHRDRVLPDLRGVVVVVPTRQRRDYGNMFENAVKGAANLQAHWFIRNGDRIYVMVTDDEKLRVGDRILPKRDEFVKFFYAQSWGGESEPLAPGSAQWIEAEDRADKVKRHYMRLMLILQGLVDRTVAFHPLPEGGVNLMSVASQDLGTVVLMNENDHILTDGRIGFREWQATLNKELRPGVRVILGRGIGEHYNRDYGENSRISPPKASYPPVGEPLLIEERKADGALVVRYARTDAVWRKVWVETKPGWGYYTHDEVVPSQRASARIYASDSWVLPFELATVEELTYYLNHRGARRTYQEMVPVIQAALRAKATESTAEAPLRALLLSTIAGETLDADEAERELVDLIAWWKSGHKWSRGALAGDPQVEKTAAVAIVAEWRKRQKAKPKPAAVKAVVAAAQALDGALVAAYTRSKKFIVWTPAAVGQQVYVTEHVLDRTGKVVETRPWTTPNARVLSTMLTLWETPEWATWNKYPETGNVLTGPELESVVAALTVRLAERGSSTPIVATSCADEQSVTVFAWRDDADITDYAHYTDMLDRRHYDRAEPFIDAESTRWHRKNSTVVLAGRPWSAPRFFHYSGGKFGEGISLPYRHGEYRVASSDEVKVWEDPEQLQRAITVLGAHEDRRRVESEAGRNERWKIGGARNAYIAALRESYEAMLAADAKGDFEADFGVTAAERPDLWAHHVATLRLDQKVPKTPGDFAASLDRLLRAGVELWGKTVAELADIDRELVADEHHALDQSTLGRWADLRVAAPDHAQSGQNT